MKTVVITGASRGIGRELAHQFLADNHKVIAIARDEHALKQINHVNYQYIALDLMDNNFSETVVHNIGNQKIDILINNAGLLINKVFSELTSDDFLRSYQVNYLAPIKLIQTLEHNFSENSHIVNISTMGAVQGSAKFPTLSAYGGSKAALCHLTEILAEEWNDRKISVNCLALGAVQTEMLSKAFPDYKANVQALEMAIYIKDFALNGAKFHNGKILQVSNSTP